MQKEYHICEVPTQRYLAVKPRLSLPSKIPTKSIEKPVDLTLIPTKTLPRRRVSRKHALYVGAYQSAYAAVAAALIGLAWHYLASQPVYRWVSLAIIAILWSNVAGRVALKKSIDMLATVSVRAIRIKKQGSMESPALTDSTNVFLQSIKSSFLEKSNEVR